MIGFFYTRIREGGANVAKKVYGIIDSRAGIGYYCKRWGRYPRRWYGIDLRGGSSAAEGKTYRGTRRAVLDRREKLAQFRKMDFYLGVCREFEAEIGKAVLRERRDTKWPGR